ncbi:MAG: hypothetical protein N3D84_01645 [Candidatus Woesearchaeota archaeon]|nr:hypothetical protein [Candidatus Woesearchaeota archaeon]
MAKSIVFDAGPIITLATNNLLYLLDELKKDFNGDFIMPSAVKKELVDRPLQSKRFKFEALQVLSCINKGTLKVVDDPKANEEANSLLDIANRIFRAKGNYIQIVHIGEISAVALAVSMNSLAFIVDERTIRMLIENPENLKEIMEHKLHTNIEIDRKSLEEFKKRTKGINMIRSTELIVVAYEKGLLDNYIPKNFEMEEPRKELIDALLWGLKLNGCAISEKEIEKIIKIETKRKL